MNADTLLFILNILLTGLLIGLEFYFRKFKTDRIKIVSALVIALLSLFIIIAFIGFDTDSVSYNSVRSNGAGLIGFYIAYYTFRVLGYTAYFLPLLLSYSALGLILEFERKYFPSLYSLIIITVIPPLTGVFTRSNASGIYGSAVSDFLLRYLGNAGLTLVLIFMLLIASFVFTDLFALVKILISVIKKQSFYLLKKASSPKPKRKKKKRKKDKAPVDTKSSSKDKTPEKKDKPKAKVNIKTGYDKEIDYSRFLDDNFKKRFLDILDDPPDTTISADKEKINEKIEILEEKLRSFNVDGKVSNVNIGPVITTYEFEPSPGVKVNKITSLADDLALAMKAKSIRILGHIPGKSAVGIEIPNRKRLYVYLKNLITDRDFLERNDSTAVCIGRNTENVPVFENISDMPHLLIAGTTGSGKSVCINSLITSILFRTQPEQVRFLMVDPKRIELSIYNGIPHLERPVITDSKEAIIMLKELSEWMDIRYKEFAKLNVRNIEEYNKKSSSKKPYIVVIIDEMADLMMTASKEIEHHVTRLAQMSRAVGIHLILATQRPSVNIITGSIKANFPIRISFKVPSKADSKTILDTVGAEKLLGKGDMLFIPPQRGSAVRAHGAFIRTDEVSNIVNLWALEYMKDLFRDMVKDPGKLAELVIENELIQNIANYDNTPGSKERVQQFVDMYAEELEIDSGELDALLSGIIYHIPIEESKITEELRNNPNGQQSADNERDELYEDAKEYVIMKNKASTSMLQRHFGIGYPRAARIIEHLEEDNVIGPQNGSKPREVFYDNP
ncbi:MAG: DNA translocase FtsK [candidate division WOR-3 bacterium]|nr:DNA translocase FtsK [candidate division WOR-3 bacterium]